MHRCVAIVVDRTLPMIDDPVVSGMTLHGLRTNLQKEYVDRGFLTKSAANGINLIIKESAANKFYVGGQVKKEGAFVYSHPTTVMRSIFEAAGIRCGVLGTVAYRIGDELREATRTTPEAPDVQRLLREMVDRGCGACAMEVSSHALALRRVDETTFAAAIFTNLTRDHLDYHEDMDQYFQAKRRLFEMLPRDSPSLLNVDDPRGPSLVEMAGPGTETRSQSEVAAPGHARPWRRFTDGRVP